MTVEDLVSMLHREKCSCVVFSGGRVSLFHRRGVRDLFELLRDDPEALRGAMIADKVIGKGAAAIMAVGSATSVYADVISDPALKLLRDSDIAVSFGESVPNIINRSGTGLCPVETLCLGVETARECIPLIEKFLTDNNIQKQ